MCLHQMYLGKWWEERKTLLKILRLGQALTFRLGVGERERERVGGRETNVNVRNTLWAHFTKWKVLLISTVLASKPGLRNRMQVAFIWGTGGQKQKMNKHHKWEEIRHHIWELKTKGQKHRQNLSQKIKFQGRARRDKSRPRAQAKAVARKRKKEGRWNPPS